MGFEMAGCRWWLLALLVLAGRATEIPLGKVKTLTITVKIVKTEDVHSYASPNLSLIGNRLRYNEGEMILTRDLGLEKIIESGIGEFRLKLNGFPNSLEIIDDSKERLKEIRKMLKEALVNASKPASVQIEPSESVKKIRRISSGRTASLVNMPSEPEPKDAGSKPVEIQRPGLVRRMSRKVKGQAVDESSPPSERKTILIPVAEVKNAEVEEAPIQSVRKSEKFGEHLQNFQQLAKAKSEKTSPEGRRAAEKTSPENMRTLDRSRPPIVQEEGSERDKELKQASSGVKNMIANFTPVKMTPLQRRESEKHLRHVPRRAVLRDSPFFKTEENKKTFELTGIGKEELELRRQLFRKKQPDKLDQDGRAEGSRRLGSIWFEQRRRRPVMTNPKNEPHPRLHGHKRVASDHETRPRFHSHKRSVSDVVLNRSLSKGVDGVSKHECPSKHGNSASSSDEEKSESEDYLRLCEPKVTDAKVYFEEFKEAKRTGRLMDIEISHQAGIQYKAAVSVLEKVILVKRRKHEPLVQSDEMENVRFYRWTGQDVVDLIEMNFEHPSVMFQVFNSGTFPSAGDKESDRIFRVVPAAVGFCMSENMTKQYCPFDYTADSTSLLMDKSNLADCLMNWTENELLLPTWTKLSAFFEDHSKVDFGLSFSLSIESSSKYNLTVEFLTVQYKKAILDALYSGQDALVMSLPPQYTLTPLARKAINEAIQATDVYIPSTMMIYIPEVF